MKSAAGARIDFEPAALQEFLKGTLGAGGRLVNVERVGGGQSNPTYFIDFGNQKLVLRKKPAGYILPGAHAIEREFRVIKALEKTEVPVPKTVVLCEDPNILGTAFYVMERLQGRVFHDCALPGLSPDQRREIYFGLAEAMARLHAVNPAQIGLDDFGRSGNYFERQISRWSRQYKESPGPRIAALDEVAEWLPQHLPADDGRVSIAHGDFRLGNMLFHPEKADVIGILDWELATLGHPLADVAFCCIPWRSAPDEYGGILGLDFASFGIPSESEFLAHYFKCAVPTSPSSRFHMVFALFRFAVIFQGIADRANLGNASSDNAGDVGRLAAKFAARARTAILTA